MLLAPHLNAQALSNWLRYAGHNRLIHSSGLNFGGSVQADGRVKTPRVRIAAIQDYQRIRPRTFLKYGPHTPQADGSYLPEEYGPDADPEQLVDCQWHHDVLTLAPPRPTNPTRMWEDWNLGQRAVSPSPGEVGASYWHEYGLVSEDVPLACGLEGDRPLKAIATRGEDGVWRQREQILPIRIPHVAPTDNCTE